MLGHVAKNTLKDFLRLINGGKPTCMPKWDSMDKKLALKRVDMETAEYIEVATHSVGTQGNQANEDDTKILRKFKKQVVLSFISCAVLLTNIVAILLILFDFQTDKGSTDYKSEVYRHKSEPKSNFCLKQRQSSLQCFSDVQFLRILAEMMALAYGRHLLSASNIMFPAISTPTSRQGYVTGGGVVDPKNRECSMASTETRFKDIDYNANTNSLQFLRKGLYMVYVNLEFRSLERCHANPVTFHLKDRTGRTIITDTIFHKEGLIVAQPKSYLTFVRLKSRDSLYFQISDTSTLESDWKSNVIGGVFIS